MTQGGDWGFFITRLVGFQYPNHCLASHTNFVCVRPSPIKALWQGIQYLLGWQTESEKAGFARTNWYVKEGSGYLLEQSTKPSTLGFAMADSPTALLAWIYEKLHDWTDNYPWTDDEILTWVSIYQFSTAGPAASLRIYYEATHIGREKMRNATEYIPKVPLGVSFYPKDLFALPTSWGSCLGPIVFETTHQEGGHFAAHECPEVFAEDLRKMFGSGGGAEQVSLKFKLDS